MNKHRLLLVSIFLSLVTILGLTGCQNRGTGKNTVATFDPSRDSYEEESVLLDKKAYKDFNATNEYDLLSVPTYVTRIEDQYFIVDCYHNQVVYNDNMTDPIKDWKVMTRDINMGHTIASDGRVYLIDDTENHRILIMEKTSDTAEYPQFIATQEFTSIGTRPHYIIYDEQKDTFFVLSSMTGEIFCFRSSKEGRVYLTEKMSVPELDGYYVRSFTIIDDKIYFVSGNASIIEASLDDLSIIKSYPVPFNMYGMVQLSKIQDYYYITVSTDGSGDQRAATIIRTRRLEDLINEEYEDIYNLFIGGGTPYCITSVDDTYYLCEHRISGHTVWSFNVNNNNIENIESLY